SRIESEHLRCRQCPCRRWTKSDLNRRIPICPSSDVLCRLVPFHRHATCARIVVDIVFVSCVYTHSRRPHLERRKSAYAGFARLRRIYAQRQVPIDSKRLVKRRLLRSARGRGIAAPFFFRLRMSQLCHKLTFSEARVILLYPQKRTMELSRGMSALCQKRTLLIVVLRLRLRLCSGPQQQPENHCMRDEQRRHDKCRNVKRRAQGCRIDTNAD